MSRERLSLQFGKTKNNNRVPHHKRAETYSRMNDLKYLNYNWCIILGYMLHKINYFFFYSLKLKLIQKV